MTPLLSGPSLISAAPPANDATETPLHRRGFERGDQVEIAERLLEVLSARGECVADEGEIYAYDGSAGVWSPVASDELSRIVQSFAGAPLGGEKVLKIGSSVINGATKLAAQRVARRGFFAAAPKGIAFADRFVRVTASGIDVQPHAAEHRARFAYAFPYERAPTARLIAFLNSVWRDDADREQKIALIQEFGGACLVGSATTYQCAIMAHGDGENGKGVLSKLLERAMPSGSTVAIPPQNLSSDYNRASLAGKLLNLVSEVPEKRFGDSSAFKAIVAGDPIRARTIFCAPFDFRPVAGHFFATNRLPEAADMSHGFWRRFIVVGFNRRFLVGDPDRNANLAEEIIAAELPAIVAWCLDGAARLLAQGQYTYPPSHQAALAAWRKHVDPVALFVDDRTRPLGPNELGGEPARRIYGAFCEWCRENGHRRIASNAFGMRMRGLGMGSVHTASGNRYPVVLTASGA